MAMTITTKKADYLASVVVRRGHRSFASIIGLASSIQSLAAERDALRKAAKQASAEARDALLREEELEAHVAELVTQQNQLIGLLELSIKHISEAGENPKWLGAACRILNAGFTKGHASFVKGL